MLGNVLGCHKIRGLYWHLVRRRQGCCWASCIAQDRSACVCAESLQPCPVLRPYVLQPTRLLCPWDSPDKNTAADCKCPPPSDLPDPGIFLTQGSNLCLLHLPALSGKPPGKSSVRSHSHIQLFVTPWTVAGQSPLSMGFPRQEYWSGVPCPTPGNLPDPGIEPSSFMSPVLAGWQADSLPLRPPRKPVLLLNYSYTWGFPGGSDGKESACTAGDWSLIQSDSSQEVPDRSGSSPGKGNDYPLQYSCLQNSMDRGSWQVTVHGSRRVGHDWAMIT